MALNLEKQLNFVRTLYKAKTTIADTVISMAHTITIQYDDDLDS